VHYEYDRKRNYIVPILAPEVQRVTIHDMDYLVTANPRQFTIVGVEHCIEEASTEVIFDALKSEQRDWKSYLLFDKEVVSDLAKFAPEGNIVVQPEMHASAAVRQVLASMLRPIQADKIHAEIVDIQKVGLYFRPVYAFEYKWETKGKIAVAEFDGLTGAMTTGGIPLRQQVGKIITPDLIFDVSVDAINLLVPGGSIAVKVAKSIVDSRQH
jgi:hypothetical protein